MKEKRLILTGKKLTLKEFDLEQSLESDEVLVKTKFAGVNFADIHMVKGLYPDAPKTAFTPGYELSGEVLKKGEQVTEFELGDLVVGGVHFGAMSSVVKVKKDYLFKIPEGLDLEQASALPVSLLTAMVSLFELGRVREDERVLLDAGTGSLGQVQIALLKSSGVKDITGLTRTDTTKYYLEKQNIKAMTHEELANNNEVQFDLIINSRGPHIYVREQRKNLAPLGRVVFLGASDLIDSNPFSFAKKAVQFFRYKNYDLQELMNENQVLAGVNMLRLFSEKEVIRRNFEVGIKLLGDFKPKVHKVFPIDQYRKAYDEVSSGRSKGKVLLNF